LTIDTCLSVACIISAQENPMCRYDLAFVNLYRYAEVVVFNMLDRASGNLDSISLFHV
jgi:hypothetical protein